jgi:membrane protease YdiL (CAAX protease family)
MTNGPPPTAPASAAPLGPRHAWAAYAVLLFGFLALGAAAQMVHVLAGLWASEAIAIALPAFLWILAAGVKPGPLLGLAPVSWKWIAITVVTALLNQPAVTLLEHLAHSHLPHDWVVGFDQKTAFLENIFRRDFWPMTLTVVIAAPLGEELFFRGFAFPLLAWGGSPAKDVVPYNTPLVAALISGALFSAIHMDPIGFVGLMEIGVWLAVLRWGSGSLLAPLLGHALNNGAAALAFRMGWQDPTETPPLWLLGVGALCLLLLVVFSLRVLSGPALVPAEQRLTAGSDGKVRHGRPLALWIFWAACCAVGLVKMVQLSGKLGR